MNENANGWNRERGLKVLTIWQPWAWWIAAGAKPVENREWIPPSGLLMPGEDLAIHAAKKEPSQSEFRTALTMAKADGYAYRPTWEVWRQKHCALGSVVAVVRYEGIVRKAEELPRGKRSFFVGRYGWRLSFVRQLREPIPCRGQQGLQRLDHRAEDKLHRLLSGIAPSLHPSLHPWRVTAPALEVTR